MKKKLFTTLLALSVIAVTFCSTTAVTEKKADAAVFWGNDGIVYGNLCCDIYGYSQCIINWTPVGNACWCNRLPGVGAVCNY